MSMGAKPQSRMVPVTHMVLVHRLPPPDQEQGGAKRMMQIHSVLVSTRHRLPAASAAMTRAHSGCRAKLAKDEMPMRMNKQPTQPLVMAKIDQFCQT